MRKIKYGAVVVLLTSLGVAILLSFPILRQALVMCAACLLLLVALGVILCIADVVSEFRLCCGNNNPGWHAAHFSGRYHVVGEHIVRCEICGRLWVFAGYPDPGALFPKWVESPEPPVD